jgi:glycosyltransferase involved in cell wall biosynthesis
MSRRLAELESDQRLSLAFLVPDLSPYGEAATARLLATELPADQFRVNVVVIGRPAEDDRKSLTAAGIAVEAIPVRHMMGFVGARRLRRVIQAWAPSVIHAWGTAAARMARSLGSGPADSGPRLVVSAAARAEGGLGGWLAARRIRRADRVVPATRADGERYRRLGVSAEQLTLIAPSSQPIDTERARDGLFGELGLPPDARLIVAGGRSERGIGPKDAIMAFDMLRYEAKDLYLVVFGAESETRALDRFGHSIAFDDYRVRFAAASPHRARAIAHATAALVTDPAGGVDEALAAMTAGKPVVGWRTPDLAEIVEDKATGLLAPIGDRPALAAAMRSVLENPKYGQRLGAAGQARALERFALPRMVEQFSRLYRELVS